MGLRVTKAGNSRVGPQALRCLTPIPWLPPVTMAKPAPPGRSATAGYEDSTLSTTFSSP